MVAGFCFQCCYCKKPSIFILFSSFMVTNEDRVVCFVNKIYLIVLYRLRQSRLSSILPLETNKKGLGECFYYSISLVKITILEFLQKKSTECRNLKRESKQRW